MIFYGGGGSATFGALVVSLQHTENETNALFSLAIQQL